MVQRTEIVREAKRTAQRTVEEADDEARRLRHEAEDYCDQKLAGFEIVLERTIKTVQAGREKLQVTPLPPAGGRPTIGAVEPGERRAVLRPGPVRETGPGETRPMGPLVVNVADLAPPTGARRHERLSAPSLAGLAVVGTAGCRRTSRSTSTSTSSRSATASWPRARSPRRGGASAAAASPTWPARRDGRVPGAVRAARRARARPIRCSHDHVDLEPLARRRCCWSYPWRRSAGRTAGACAPPAGPTSTRVRAMCARRPRPPVGGARRAA